MPKYTDQQIVAAIRAADPAQSPSLRTGIPAYLALAPEEQVVVNRSLRRLTELLPKTGPVMALKVYTAVCRKTVRGEASNGLG